VTRSGALRCALVALLASGLAAGCGTQPARVTVAAPPAVTVSLNTSLVTAQGTWAIAVMGGSAASQNDFWQLFVRPAGASRWSLVTPPGVADNGGLVAAGGTGGTASLLVGFRPSQALAFSPLAASTDAGRHWTPGLLDAALADVPDGISVAPSGQVIALLSDGTIQTAGTTAAAVAGQWSQLTTVHALAATAPGRTCGLLELNAVSFGPNKKNPVTAGSCARPGVAGVFTDSGGTWLAAGPAVPAGWARRQVQVLGLGSTAGGNVALLLAGSELIAAWSTGSGWTTSAVLGGAAGVRAAGFGAGGSAWVLLGGGRAEAIGGPGGAWRGLPAVPAGTAALAPGPGGPGGPGGSFDALAVAGSRLTVWQLGAAATAWTKAQAITVPIEYGSSS
jgi:hypothetical protein